MIELIGFGLKKMQLPTIEMTKMNSAKKSGSSDTFILPSISKSNSGNDSDRSIILSPKEKSHKRSGLYTPSSRTGSTPDSDLSDYNEVSDEKKSKSKTISKYYYLKPLYVHPEREEQIGQSKVKKKAFEIPQELSLKVNLKLF